MATRKSSKSKSRAKTLTGSSGVVRKSYACGGYMKACGGSMKKATKKKRP